MKYTLLTLLLLVIIPSTVAADTPSVASFVASPTTINSGTQVDFSWTLQNAGGYSFLIPCSSGIKFKKADGGTFTCDTRISSTTKTNDLVRVAIVNISGGTRNITARIIPKDAAGQDYDAASRDITISVATHPQPITNFTASATTTTTGQPITISWTSQEIDGVNLSMECARDEVKVTSSNYSGNLPCGAPIFSSDLAPSSSLTLNFTNSFTQAVPVKFTLLPAFAAQSYDGSHASYLTLEVASDILPDPIVQSFTASSTLVNSYTTLNTSWVVEKAVGTNIKISCVSGLSATSTRNPSLKLPCDTPAFTDMLPSSGSVGLVFRNEDKTNANVTISLLPAKKAGEYDAIRGKSTTLTVAPIQISAATSSPLPTQTPPAPTTTPLLPAATTTTKSIIAATATSRVIFKRGLGFGSRGEEVTLLQQFLKKDPVLYPEGLVTGYFGPATKRAVQRFQKKHNIATESNPGYGYVGPKTRTKLNSLQ